MQIGQCDDLVSFGNALHHIVAAVLSTADHCDDPHFGQADWMSVFLDARQAPQKKNLRTQILCCLLSCLGFVGARVASVAAAAVLFIENRKLLLNANTHTHTHKIDRWSNFARAEQTKTLVGTHPDTLDEYTESIILLYRLHTAHSKQSWRHLRNAKPAAAAAECANSASSKHVLNNR